MPHDHPDIYRGIRSAQLGLLANAGLVVVKVVAGVVGHSFALVADGIESSTDVFSSLIVWRGLSVSGRSADEEFHFGYGKAESVAAAVVALLLLGAATTITVTAVREIRSPHLLPAPFTLGVLAGVILVKELLFRRVAEVGAEVGSTAVQTDAWHHRSDAISSGAAFIGISAALLGGPGWEAADDYAALVAALVIAANGVRLLRPAVFDLMDRAPDADLLERVTHVAMQVPGVLHTEKLRARKVGLGYFIDLHVQADPFMSLHDAHELSGRVKGEILRRVPTVADALIHMEPYEDPAHL